MKTVFFDFDGTLTKNCIATWYQINNIMKRNGAPITGELYQMFMNEQINYKEWCELTIEKMKKYNVLKADLDQVSLETKLINGVNETFEKLHNNGWRIHIISGGISQVIRQVLGDSLKFVDNISANEVFFNEDGTLKNIIATEFDYKGKATYIENYMKATNSSKDELVFVGNGSNDEFVASTGITTICLNPDDTDPNNKEVWKYALVDSNNLQDTLSIILRINDDLSKSNII